MLGITRREGGQACALRGRGLSVELQWHHCTNTSVAASDADVDTADDADTNDYANDANAAADAADAAEHANDANAAADDDADAADNNDILMMLLLRSQ